MPGRRIANLVAPAVVDGGSAVGVDQAQGDQGGLCGLVSQLAAKTFNVETNLIIHFMNIAHVSIYRCIHVSIYQFTCC